MLKMYNLKRGAILFGKTANQGSERNAEFVNSLGDLPGNLS